MREPRTFRARLILLEVGRPLSVAEVAPLLQVPVKKAAGAIDCLVRAQLVRRVSVRGCKRFKYEAVA